MRSFHCVFNDFSIAIPMDSISSLMLYTGETSHQEAVIHNNENMTYYVSLFCLFNLPPEKVRHGIILKSKVLDNSIALLSAPVEEEIEIPDDKIYPIPKTLGAMPFSSFFSGIQFLGDKPNVKPLLIFNTEQLKEYILRGRGL
jgi:hypothetical protein